MSVQLQSQPSIQYVSDSEGKPVSVIIPINLWDAIQQDLRSEQETAYLLGSETMKKRLIEAKNRIDGISLEDVRARIGI